MFCIFLKSDGSILDWEEMMDEPRLDLYPLDYDDANHTGALINSEMTFLCDISFYLSA